MDNGLQEGIYRRVVRILGDKGLVPKYPMVPNHTLRVLLARRLMQVTLKLIEAMGVKVRCKVEGQQVSPWLFVSKNATWTAIELDRASRGSRHDPVPLAPLVTTNAELLTVGLGIMAACGVPDDRPLTMIDEARVKELLVK